MKKLVYDCIKLVIITAVAGLALGVVYSVTKEPIAAGEAKKQQEAYESIFPDADSFEDVEGFSEEAASAVIEKFDNPIDGHGGDKITEAVTACDASGEAIGYIFNVTTSQGYGGDIEFTLGIESDGTLCGYSILSIGETAGLGMKAKDDPDWGTQFDGIPGTAFDVVKDGSGSSDDTKINAISGATITSKAMTGAVNSCVAYFQTLEGGN